MAAGVENMTRVGCLPYEEVVKLYEELRRVPSSVHGVDGEDLVFNIKRKRLDVFARSNRCARCGCEGREFRVMVDKAGNHHVRLFGDLDIELTVDHVVAKSHGGTEALDNLTTLCKPCNVYKAARCVDVLKELDEREGFGWWEDLKDGWRVMT
jgi:5-methylcytosine-specific restriction endonuclease McrA